MAGTQLYWRDNCGDDFSAERSYLRTKPADSAPSNLGRIVFRTAGCTGDRIASNVVADETHYYWLSGDGRSLRTGLAAVEGVAPETIASTGGRFGGYPPWSLIAVDETSIYWNTAGEVWRSDRGPARRPSELPAVCRRSGMSAQRAASFT